MSEHRIVWEQHNGPIPDGMTIDHINGNKKDNRIENLQMLSRKDNIKRSSYGTIRKICNRYEAARTMNGTRTAGFFDTKCGAYMFNMARRYL